MDLDLLRSTDLKWLNAAQQKVDKSFSLKNLATYVDVDRKSFLLPNEQISESASKELLELAFECLRAHWHSESQTNPVLKELTDKSIGQTS